MPKRADLFAPVADERTGRGVWTVLLVAALAALLAAFMLSIDKVRKLENPDAALSCSINLILDCGGVINTWQASLFGFANSFIGIAAFAVIVTVAMGGLLGVRYSRIYLIAAQAALGIGALFAYWLFFQSVYVIEVLCPWCLVVTATTTIMFETLLYYNLRNNIFDVKKATNTKIQHFLDKQFDRLIVASWFVLLVSLVVVKFGESLWG